jgi:DNA (cytosine-5)-methyltransferase 1
MDGLKQGSGTKSALLWECEKAIRCKKPKWLVMENVPALLAECFRGEFDKWKNTLVRMGYTNYVQKLNAKDYGDPQNRERVFMVSVMDGCGVFHFAENERLGKFMYELLERDVDKKYYLSEKRIQGMIKSMKIQKYRGRSFKFKPRERKNHISFCITTNEGNVKTSNYVIESDGTRKLTERELFRLMDVSEADIEILTGVGISRTQLRKLAGNSIVVNVFYHVLRKLFVDKDSDSGQYELKFE